MNDTRILFSLFLTFLTFSFVLGFLPSEIYGNTYSYERDVPDYFAGLDIAVYAATTTFKVNDSTFDGVGVLGVKAYSFNLGGYDWLITVDNWFNRLGFGVKNYFSIIYMGTTSMEFKHDLGSNRGIELLSSEMNQDYVSSQSWIKYRMYNSRNPEIGCDVLLGFDTSLYSSPGEALADQELLVYVGMGIEDTVTTVNAWQLIANLVLFSPPNIHPLVNIFIKTVFWGLFAFAFVLFVGRFIPLIQGGA